MDESGRNRHEIRIQVLRRDNYECQHEGCTYREKPGVNQGESQLECHDIVYKEDGGQYIPENLVLICKYHHTEHHAGRLNLVLKKTGVMLKAKRNEGYYSKKKRQKWRKQLIVDNWKEVQSTRVLTSLQILILLYWLYGKEM